LPDEPSDFDLEVKWDQRTRVVTFFGAFADEDVQVYIEHVHPSVKCPPSMAFGHVDI
jgi:hypothetical protein